MSNLTKFKDINMSDIKVENPFHTARLKPKRKGKKPPKLLAVVHQSGCTGCEVCIAGCPVDSIELVPGPDPMNPGFRQLVEIDLSRCIGCQNCSQDCPWETISMYNQDNAYLAWSNENLESELYKSIPEVQNLKEKYDPDFGKIEEPVANSEEAEPTESA
jgi:formate hydrogenlyase subunit 6/NADH:ubiquinone oxidoreductase subunit I